MEDQAAVEKIIRRIQEYESIKAQAEGAISALKVVLKDMGYGHLIGEGEGDAGQEAETEQGGEG